MKKKSLITMLAALALVGAIGVGATLAYFTDADAATNVITMGKVDVDFDEPNYPGDEENKVTDVVPGKVIPKDPTITVKEDSLAAYVRASVTLDEALTEAQKADLMAGIVINDGWELSADGYYYYQTVVNPGEAAVLFNEVVIPEKWGNEVAGMEFAIDVAAEAIQADGFEPTMTDGKITAWTYSDGSAVEADTYEEKMENQQSAADAE